MWFVLSVERVGCDFFVFLKDIILCIFAEYSIQLFRCIVLWVFSETTEKDESVSEEEEEEVEEEEEEEEEEKKLEAER